MSTEAIVLIGMFVIFIVLFAIALWGWMSVGEHIERNRD